MPIPSLAKAISFAHLGGLVGMNKKADEDEDKKTKKAADDSDKDQDREDGDAKSAASEDQEDENARASDGDEDDDGDEDKKKSKAKKAKKAEDDEDDEDASAEDDSDDEMRGQGKAAAARRRERARCAAIIGSKAAAKNIVVACNLAFNTKMSRTEAIATLEGLPSSPDARASRRNPNLGAGGESSASSSQAIAARWDAAMQKARPPKKA